MIVRLMRLRWTAARLTAGAEIEVTSSIRGVAVLTVPMRMLTTVALGVERRYEGSLGFAVTIRDGDVDYPGMTHVLDDAPGAHQFAFVDQGYGFLLEYVTEPTVEEEVLQPPPLPPPEGGGGGVAEPVLECDARLQLVCEPLVNLLTMYAAARNLTLRRMELLRFTPDAVIATATAEGIAQMLDLYQIAATVEAVRGMTLAEYLEFVETNGILSSVCGDTAGFLESLLYLGPPPDPLRGRPIVELLQVLASRDPACWYCRVSRRPHAFFIECINGQVRVYQSYFSKYMLAVRLEQMEVMPLAEFLEVFAAALLGPEAAPRLRLFSAALSWVEETIDYTLFGDRDHADAEEVLRRLDAIVSEQQLQWQEALDGQATMAELCPEDDGAEPEERAAPPTLSYAAADLPMIFAIEADAVHGLQPGTVLLCDIYEGARYTYVGTSNGQCQFELLEG